MSVPAQPTDGTALLLKFTAQMSLGGRRAALAYRDALSTQQQKSFYHAFRTTWIPVAMGEPRAGHWAISFCACGTQGLAEMLWDLGLIARTHGCSVHVEVDERSHTGQLIFGNTSEPVRAVLLAWMRGYGRAVFDEATPANSTPVAN
jgi:hypothetical protein